jgi:polygalacturonase
MPRYRKFVRSAAIEYLESRLLFTSIPLPVIPTGSGHLFVVTSSPYNAVGDGSTNDTAAIQAAINACNAAGGGTVEIPVVTGAKNIYEFTQLTLGSNTNFQIDAGAELQIEPMGVEPAGVTCIEASHDSNLEITGGGDIDGNGASGWWNSTTAAPKLIHIDGVSTCLVQDITISNAPLGHLYFGRAGTTYNNNVTVNDVTIQTPSPTPNTEGISITGFNFLVENCTVNDGDDDIVVAPQNSPAGNITIENCTIGTGHGISVGGETNDGLNGLLVNNVTFNNTVWGIRLKAGRGNGGLVENLVYSNITMTNVQYPFYVDSYYVGGSDTLPTNPSTDPGQTVNTTTPIWQNVTFTNITSTDTNSNSVAGVIYGLPEAPATDFNFQNVNITATTGFEIDHARNVTFDSLSHITVTTGADLISSLTSPQFPSPYDTTVLAAGFVNQDIGSPTVPTGTSSVLYDPDAKTWTILGDGAGLATSTDQFNYSYEPAAGNGSMTAELKSLTGVSGAVPQAGLMYRVSTDPNAPFVALLQDTSNDDLIMESRSTPGGPIVTDDISTSAGLGATYIQLTRTGNTFAASYGPDNIHWTTLGSVTLPGLPTTIEAGLFATAASNGNLTTAVFSYFSATLTPGAAPAPQVDNVTVDGTAWNPSFITYLAGLNAANVNGYSIPVGSSAQLTPLPWNNINQLNITFTQNVNVTESSLQLVGANVSNYSFSNFTYNSTTDTATWTLAGPIAADKLQIDLNGASVTNSSTEELDGAWTDTVSTYPSGNGNPGGNFLFSFDVLPGDANQSGGVTIQDVLNVVSEQGTSTTTPATYNIFDDINASGGITIQDVLATVSVQGTSLPAETPAVSAITTAPLALNDTPTSSVLKKHHR